MNDQYGHAPRQTDPMAPVIKEDEGELPPPAVCSFEAEPLQGNASLTVQFNNFSQNAAFVTWGFGDNSTSNDWSPSHTYEEPGEYTIELIVVCMNPWECEDVCTETIIVGDEFIEGEPEEGEGPFGATIFCTVLDSETDLPITNASIETVPATIVVTSNTNGVYVLNELPSGTYTVTASAPDYDSESQVISINSTEEKEIIFHIGKSINDCDCGIKERRILFCGALTASGSHTGDLVLLGLLLASFTAAPYLRKRVN
jgi:PKD repeat protein